MAEFFISGFIIVLFSSIGIKYLYDSCKKDPVNINFNENIITTERVENNLNDNELPPKYEEVPPQY